MSAPPVSSLRIRLLLLVLLAVLPALGLLLNAAVERRREGAARAHESAARLVFLAAHDHQATIQETGLLLRGLAQLPGARAGDPALCRTELAPLLDSYPRYLNLGVVRTDASPLCSVRDIPAGMPPSAGLRTALAGSRASGELGVSGYTVGRISGRPLIMFAQPVRGGDDRIIGAVFAALSLDWLGELASRARLPEGAVLRVVDRNGVVLVRHPDDVEPSGRDLAGTALFRQLQRSADGGTFTVVTQDGARYLHASARLQDHRGETQAYLDIGIPARQAYAAADRSLGRSLLWLALLAALTMAAAWYGGHFFVVRRVDALLDATRRLQAGDLSARTGIAPGPGELEQLARAFDEMAEALQSRQREAERTAVTLRRQALVFDTLLEGVLVTDPEGRIVDWNPAAERMFGYSRQEMLGRSPAVFHHPALRGDLEAAIVQAMRTTGHWTGEVPFVRKDGSNGISEAVVVAQYDEQGRRVAHIGVNRDITERKRAERALRESEEHFRAVFEHAPIGIAEGGVGGDALRVNPAMQRLLALPAECSLPDLLERTDPAHREEDRRRFDALLDGELDGYRSERRYLRPDGSEVWGILHVAIAREADGTPRSLFALVEDVTERRQAEQALALSQEELRHAQKMEAVGRLAGGVAHDFNNLLTAIRGNVELVLLDLPDSSPLREELEQIRQAADTASSLTRQLLAYSSRRPQEPRTVDVNATVAGTAQMVRRMIGSSVELTTELEPEPLSIRIDPGQLEQVLINLAINARDAMPDGGELRIRSARLRLTEDDPARRAHVAPGDYVELTVSDTGAGIDPQLQSRIFEPFFTTKERERGTGLGLFLVYGIVTQNGGHIWVESEPGRGTTFRVLLPLAAEGGSAAPAPPSPAPGAARGEETVLLVDDEDAVRRLAHRLLERAGYRVLPARNGEEALRISSQHSGPIHLLLSDITMPRMSGGELAERLAAERPDTRVLFMSGYTEEQLPRDRTTGEPPAFVQKPFTADVLVLAVREALTA